MSFSNSDSSQRSIKSRVAFLRAIALWCLMPIKANIDARKADVRIAPAVIKAGVIW
jgi:hypothetical protein